MFVNKYISIQNKTNDVAEILIYGDICDKKWYDEDVTPKEIYEALSNLGSIKSLDVRICSYGGSVFAGNAIYSVLNTFREEKNVTINVYIDGIAASMATGISCVGDKVYISENGTFMIHDPIASVTGNANDFKKGIELLEHAKETLISNYMHRFNAGEEKLRELMSAESWLTAEEAKNYGFVDEITGAVQIAASSSGIKIGNQTFGKNVADLIKDKYKINTKKEVNDMQYDESLSKYGITENAFNEFLASSSPIASICDSVLASIADSIKNGETVFDVGEDGKYHATQNICGTDFVMTVDNLAVDSFMTSNQAVDALGKELTADEILALAKDGMEMDHDADTKAKAYDALVKSAIDEAIKNGIKAKGESFNQKKWEKILASLDYDEILDQSKEWAEEAKSVLHAGNRVSEPYKPDNTKNDGLVNPDDYKF